MHLDVLDLRNFYYRTRLGRAAQKAIRDRVLKIWPKVDGQQLGPRMTQASKEYHAC